MSADSGDAEKTHPVGFFATFCQNARLDFWSYLDEFVHLCGYSLAKYANQEVSIDKQHRRVCQMVTHTDVVLFGKAGCGFCGRAKEALDGARTRGTSTFTYLEENINQNTRHGSVVAHALRTSIQISSLTYPQVFIRGRYVGGADDTIDLLQRGDFPRLLAMEIGRCEKGGFIPWEQGHSNRSREPKIFEVPRMGGPQSDFHPVWPWYVPQLTIWSNLVKQISTLHVGIMVPALILYHFENMALQHVANALVLLLVIDIAVLVLLGPAPLSPTGTFCTYFGWTSRGNAISAVPYKIVWAGYLLVLLPSYVKRDYKQLTIELAAYILNSSFLAVLRF